MTFPRKRVPQCGRADPRSAKSTSGREPLSHTSISNEAGPAGMSTAPPRSTRSHCLPIVLAVVIAGAACSQWSLQDGDDVGGQVAGAGGTNPGGSGGAGRDGTVFFQSYDQLWKVSPAL